MSIDNRQKSKQKHVRNDRQKFKQERTDHNSSEAVGKNSTETRKGMQQQNLRTERTKTQREQGVLT